MAKKAASKRSKKKSNKKAAKKKVVKKSKLKKLSPEQIAKGKKAVAGLISKKATVKKMVPLASKEMVHELFCWLATLEKKIDQLLAAPQVVVRDGVERREATKVSEETPAAQEKANGQSDLFALGGDAKDEAAAPVTKEEMTQALQQVIAKHGDQKAVELVSLHGVQRISELKPELYGLVVRDCQAALAL